MKVRDLIAALQALDADDMFVDLVWVHGAAPGPPSEVKIETYQGKPIRVVVRGGIEQ